MLIFYGETTLENGFDILTKEPRDRLLRGRTVSACSGIELFKSLRGQPIKCYRCGCVADRWIADKHANDKQGPPVLNLYATDRNGQLVLMTRDHIIPKSVGGIDHIDNLRPACATCNEQRGNKLSRAELAFRRANMHLISPERYAKGLARAMTKPKVYMRPFRQIAADDARTEIALVDK